MAAFSDPEIMAALQDGMFIHHVSLLDLTYYVVSSVLLVSSCDSFTYGWQIILVFGGPWVCSEW